MTATRYKMCLAAHARSRVQEGGLGQEHLSPKTRYGMDDNIKGVSTNL